MELDQDLRAYRTVQKWVDVVNQNYHLSEQEWVGRLDLLREFCLSENTDPDTMIAEARSDRADKLDYMRRLRRFVGELTTNERLAHDYQNIVRSFFINNGARVIAKPYSDVYRRDAPPTG